jgi:hypothetical protein
LTKIAYDLLKDLNSRGLVTTDIRIRYQARNTKASGRTSFTSFVNFQDFENRLGYIINDRRFLCSAGRFPIIENIKITNTNLNFANSYRWYNITGSRNLVKEIKYDSLRSPNYETEIQRYLDLMNSLFDTYVSNTKLSIDERLNSYVDPCYVDAGYVSPNSEPVPYVIRYVPDKVFVGNIPAIAPGLGRRLAITFTPNGYETTLKAPDEGFANISDMLAWVSIYWGNFGRWSINEAGQLQINTIRKFTAATKITITPLVLPVLQIEATGSPFQIPTLDNSGLPCQAPYDNGSQIIYPSVKHRYSFKITNISDVECSRFTLKLSGDWSKVKNPIISGINFGSATIKGSIIEWEGTLPQSIFVSMTIEADVTSGGSAKVDLANNTIGFVNPGLGSEKNQAYVPTNYQIGISIDPTAYAYSENPYNSINISCYLTLRAYIIYAYSSNLTASSVNSPISGPNTYIRPIQFSFQSSAPIPYAYTAVVSEPVTTQKTTLADITNYLNSARFPLGYFYSSIYQGIPNTVLTVNMLTYYDILDGSGVIGNIFEIKDTAETLLSYSGPSNQWILNIPDLLVYPVIGDTYTAYGTCLDLYIP